MSTSLIDRFDMSRERVETLLGDALRGAIDAAALRVARGKAQDRSNHWMVCGDGTEIGMPTGSDDEGAGARRLARRLSQGVDHRGTVAGRRHGVAVEEEDDR